MKKITAITIGNETRKIRDSRVTALTIVVGVLTMLLAALIAYQIIY